MTSHPLICCGVVRREVEAVLAGLGLTGQMTCPDSMLHMDPEALEKALKEQISRQEGSFMLVYGDCSPHMQGFETLEACVRTPVVNCAELLLGSESYRRFRDAQAFLLLPEWACRWREVFVEHLGFHDQSLARAFMNEYRRSIVYLDTGILPVPRDVLKEIEAFFAMPVTVEPVDLGILKTHLLRTLARLKKRDTDER
jgi:hypothetical protein